MEGPCVVWLLEDKMFFIRPPTSSKPVRGISNTPALPDLVFNNTQN